MTSNHPIKILPAELELLVLQSTVCRYEHFLTDWYAKWTGLLDHPTEVSPDVQLSYRKLWEFAAINQALSERDMLKPGRKGLGFAVGREPLPSIFASHGVRIVATDLMDDRVDQVGSQVVSMPPRSARFAGQT